MFAVIPMLIGPIQIERQFFSPFRVGLTKICIYSPECINILGLSVRRHVTVCLPGLPSWRRVVAGLDKISHFYFAVTPRVNKIFY